MFKYIYFSALQVVLYYILPPRAYEFYNWWYILWIFPILRPTAGKIPIGGEREVFQRDSSWNQNKKEEWGKKAVEKVYIYKDK